jgi:hypothetical protein
MTNGNENFVLCFQAKMANWTIITSWPHVAHVRKLKQKDE